MVYNKQDRTMLYIKETESFAGTERQCLEEATRSMKRKAKKERKETVEIVHKGYEEKQAKKESEIRDEFRLDVSKTRAWGRAKDH